MIVDLEVLFLIPLPVALELIVYYRDSSSVRHTALYLRQAVYLCFMIAFKSCHPGHRIMSCSPLTALRAKVMVRWSRYLGNCRALYGGNMVAFTAFLLYRRRVVRARVRRCRDRRNGTKDRSERGRTMGQVGEVDRRCESLDRRRKGRERRGKKKVCVCVCNTRAPRELLENDETGRDA